MPEAITHYYFAQEAIKKLDNKILQMMNYSDARLFLYANFQDLPYYYSLKNIFSKKTYDLGNRLHNEKTKDLIEAMIKFIKENGFDKDNVLFLYGIVSHYVLDFNTHPYVNSLSGIYHRNDKTTKRFKGKHGLLERAIDAQMLQTREGLNIGKINLAKKYKGAFIFNFSDLEIITYMVRQNYFFSKSEEFFRLSLKRFKHFLNFTSRDFLKMKTLMFKFNDATFNRKGHTLTSNYLYKKKYNIGDYMNESHRIWLHPITGDASNESFMDLYNKSLISCNNHFKAVSEYLFYNNPKPFKLLFDNKSIDTGSLHKASEARYHSSIFLKNSVEVTKL